MQAEILVSLVLFTLVGVIVSMDVAGLTLSKTEEFCRGEASPRAWAVSNACWHAGLLGLYVLVISGVLKISPELIAFVEDALRALWTLLPALPDGLLAGYVATSRSVREHMSLILGVIALAVVWRTYSAKIISRPEQADINDLPILARSAFNVIDLVVRVVMRKNVGTKRIARFVGNQAQAALVAVDMLALAILLKSIRYIEQPVQAVMAVGIIWVVVLVMTLLSARYGMKHFSRLRAESDSHGPAPEDPYTKSIEWVRITLRLAEPFLIFYFALQLVSLLILGRQSHGVSLYFGAGILLWALVDRWTLANIIENCLTSQRSGTAGSPDAIRPVAEIVSDAGILIVFVCKVVVGAFLVTFAFASFLWMRHGNDLPEISFDAEISYILGLLGVVSAGAFFRWWSFAWIEDRLVGLLQAISAHRRTYVYMAAALFIATVFPVYGEIAESASGTGDVNIAAGLRLMFTDSHRHALQVGVWLAFFFGLAAIIDYAEERVLIEGGREAAMNSELRSRHMRELYGSLLTVGSVLLVAVGWLQQMITT